MDSYSGSEPRIFISFYLGNDTSGQPPQSSVEGERMETSDSFVTALSVAEVSPNSVNNPRVRDREGTLVTEGQADLRVAEKECAASNSCDKETDSNLQHDQPVRALQIRDLARPLPRILLHLSQLQ